MSPADVHRHDRCAGLLGKEADSRLELLDATVGGAAALGEKDEIPARR